MLHAGRDFVSNYVALELGKPDLDLIQPRRIRRREVEMHVRMRRQKITNHQTLVRRQIVQNDVDLPRRRPFDHLSEELHKLWLVWRATVLPSTLQDCVSSAPYSDNVPWR